MRYDSVYVSHERTQDYRRANEPSPSPVDTIVIKDVSVEYRYKLLRDTVERVKLEVVRDSIPYEVRITEFKEVTYTPWPVKLLAWIGAIFLLLLTIRIIRKLS